MLENPNLQKPSFKERGIARRKNISFQGEELIRQNFFDAEKKLPLVIQPSVEGLNLIAWAKDNQAFLETNLLQCGAILFRGFGIYSTNDFEAFFHGRSISLP